MTIYALGDKRPTIHEDTWIADDANVIGQVIMDEGSSVWFCATIRADHEIIHIGAGTNIQENTVMHIDRGYPLTIGKGCTIGHKVMLHGSTIGDNCLIGADALITEGKVIPDGSLVMDAPGKIVRQLDEQSIQSLKASALHYQDNMRHFREDLKAV